MELYVTIVAGILTAWLIRWVGVAAIRTYRDYKFEREIDKDADQ